MKKKECKIGTRVIVIGKATLAEFPKCDKIIGQIYDVCFEDPLSKNDICVMFRQVVCRFQQKHLWLPSRDLKKADDDLEKDRKEKKHMKTRSSFVSNSSSTSYVILVKKENYDKVLKKSDKITKEIMNQLKSNKVKVFGQNLISIEYLCGNYDTLSEIDVSELLDDKESDEVSTCDLKEEKFTSFIDELRKDKENFVEFNVDI